MFVQFRLGTDDPVYCRWSMMIMDGRASLGLILVAEPAVRLMFQQRYGQIGEHGQGKRHQPHAYVGLGQLEQLRNLSPLAHVVSDDHQNRRQRRRHERVRWTQHGLALDAGEIQRGERARHRA